MNNPEQLYCIIDYETYSEADLKKVGGHEYSVHPSTEVLCVAWRIGTKALLPFAYTRGWSSLLPESGDRLQELLCILRDPSILLVAHNAYFEQVITKNVLTRYVAEEKEIANIPTSRWMCTATLAAALALPRSLEGACLALSLKSQKDMEGNRLIQKWCKPRKPTKTNPKTRHDNPEELKRIIEYCESDIKAETELFLRCPPLTDLEREVWLLDQKINLRGFKVDRKLVSTVLKMIDEEVKVINHKTSALTCGRISSATKRNQVLKWLRDDGMDLKDLRAKSVKDSLASGMLSLTQRQMLGLRQAISKTSTAKYEAFDLRSAHDGQLRDNLLYWAASTGRWGGRGVQPQNFPRGSIKDIDTACEVLGSGDLEYVRLLYGSPMEVFSSCLRGMIIPSEGHVLDVADYAGIEARVLFWVARHEEGVKAFVEGRDLYRELAAIIFNIDHIENVTDAQRFVGKQALLGCGYNMGWKKFMSTCENLGRVVSEETAKLAVNAYRGTHVPVVQLWDKIQRAAMAAIQKPGTKYTVNRTKWWVEDGFLWCELPSKRRLAYYKPQIKKVKTEWGEMRPTIFHMGINSLSKKWELQKTYGGKLVENVVQGISRDFMAEAMLRIEDAGPWKIVLSVHDELVAERRIKSNCSNEHFCSFMAKLPAWGEGCPIKVEGWSAGRYKK